MLILTYYHANINTTLSWMLTLTLYQRLTGSRLYDEIWAEFDNVELSISLSEMATVQWINTLYLGNNIATPEVPPLDKLFGFFLSHKFAKSKSRIVVSFHPSINVEPDAKHLLFKLSKSIKMLTSLLHVMNGGSCVCVTITSIVRC